MYIAGLGIFAAVDVASCANLGRLIDSAEVCADARRRIGGRRHSLTAAFIFAAATPLIYAP